MGLTVFGALMIVLTVGAFGVDPEPRLSRSRVTHHASRSNT